MTAVPFASILGGPLSNRIMESYHNRGGLEGWQWMFLIEAVPSLILGVLVLKLLNDRVRDARNGLPKPRKTDLRRT